MAIEMEPGYQAALEGAAFLRREELRVLEVAGRAPGDMLKGILSGTIPDPMAPSGDGAFLGRSHYSTVLTPKGKMVTDLRVLPEPGDGFLLLVPEAGYPGLEAHFKKFLHPRFAETRDRSAELALLSVVGPAGAEVLRSVLGCDALTDLGGASVGLERVRSLEVGSLGPLFVLENPELGVPTLDIGLRVGSLQAMVESLERAGALALTPDGRQVLRIEAGTPSFGVDMTEDTIPVEAEIQDRAIDYGKGCYTGQEVIIRIRDRGQVNKRLRRILLDDAPVPEAGTELFPADEDRSRGWVTSACRSPRYGQTVALAYVKRGLDIDDEVRLGAPDGPRGRVAGLQTEG